jgi:drug/metabolite transporter (DMT)-like permease
MSPLATALWLGNLLCDTGGQLTFKAAAGATGAMHGLDRWRALLMNRWTWVGLVAFAGEFVLWLAFISLVPLGMAVLLGSVNILAVMVGGRMFFGEPLTPARTAASLLIASGVALVGLG